MIANATGCSSIWGASAPAMPYTTNQFGRGPAWANSLFEDNAEYGFGMFLGANAVRETLATDIQTAVEAGGMSEELKASFADWIANIHEGEGTRDRADKLSTDRKSVV